MPKRKLNSVNFQPYQMNEREFLSNAGLGVQGNLSSKETHGNSSVAAEGSECAAATGNGIQLLTNPCFQNPVETNSSSSTDSSPLQGEQIHGHKHKKRRVDSEKNHDDGASTSEHCVKIDYPSTVSEIQYWKDLAQQRGLALEAALTENQKLTEKVETLETENRELEEMLTEAKTLAEIINTIGDEEVDDSGIGKDLNTTLNTSTDTTE